MKIKVIQMMQEPEPSSRPAGTLYFALVLAATVVVSTAVLLERIWG